MCVIQVVLSVSGSQSQRAGSISSPGTEPSPNQDLNFDSGRAEACGAIARLMCSKKTGEMIQPVYLARCYMAIYQALSLVHVSGRILCSVTAYISTCITV